MREFLLIAVCTWGILYLIISFMAMDFMWHMRIFEDSAAGFVFRLVIILAVIVSLVLANTAVSGEGGR